MPTATDLKTGRTRETKIESLLNGLPELKKHFDIHKEVGEGTFSTVYLATLKSDSSVASSSKSKKRKYAIKHIVPTCHPQRIKLELKCLKIIGGLNNVAGVEFCLRNANNIVFVMPFMHHEPFAVSIIFYKKGFLDKPSTLAPALDFVKILGYQSGRYLKLIFENYYNKMDAIELSFYMKNLLMAVAQVHKFGIIHRDIKPSNFLYDRKRRQFLLVDFGLAQACNRRSSLSLSNGQSKKRKREEEDLSSPLAPKVDNKNEEEVVQATKRSNVVFKRPTAFATSSNLPNNSDQENMPGNGGEKVKVDTKRLLAVEIGRNPDNLALKSDSKHCKNATSGHTSNVNNKSCHCYGRSMTCSICLVKKALVASRAGTPGFRPPEVLLKVSNQTTAVDVWAVGIIFLSLLSHTCNFFSSPDDITALAEMITVFGIERMKKVAYSCNRHLVCSENMPGVKLDELCNSLRNRPSGKKTKAAKVVDYPAGAYELLDKLLDLNPETRITAENALSRETFLK